MFEQYENKEFPCPSRESKKRIGEPGHDSDSSWDSFCRAYCGPGAARLVKLYPRDLDLIDEAIQKTLIRSQKGIHGDGSPVVPAFGLRGFFLKPANH